MKKMYQITYRTASGLRTMVTANQGRHMHETRGQAEEWMEKFLANNTIEQLVQVFGKQSLGTFRVDSFDCYDHGDAKGIYVDE